MFLSIIIPVYGVEDYLRQCVDSVLMQNLDDYEIILVDDGSPDQCPEICDEYELEYEMIHVIHKENGGLSSARNAGILNSRGKYIMFLDSDDWWNENVMVHDMLQEVKRNPQVEMFLFTSLDYMEGNGYFMRKEHEHLSTIHTDNIEQYYQSLLNNGNLEVHAGTKILKSEFLRQNKLFFKEGILGEDSEWMIRLLRCINTIQIINKPLYIYRAGRVGSITNNIKKENISDMLGVVDSSIKYYKMNESNQPLKRYELCYCSYLWFSALGLSRKLGKVDRREVSRLFRNTKEVCDFSNSPKTKLCRYIYNVLGYNLTSFILGTYIRVKEKSAINKKAVR